MKKKKSSKWLKILIVILLVLSLIIPVVADTYRDMAPGDDENTTEQTS